MRYESNVDMDFQLLRQYRERAERYFMDTPYEELKEKADMWQVWGVLGYLNKRSLRSLRLET